jgi:hypothetical protein
MAYINPDSILVPQVPITPLSQFNTLALYDEVDRRRKFSAKGYQ